MDVRFDLRSFNSTDAEASAVSEAGRALFAAMFGAGAVSVTLPKSKAADFAEFCERKGLLVA